MQVHICRLAIVLAAFFSVGNSRVSANDLTGPCFWYGSIRLSLIYVFALSTFYSTCTSQDIQFDKLESRRPQMTNVGKSVG